MGDADTAMGGCDPSFPRTRWTLLRSAADPEAPDYRASIEGLAATYWRPVYAHFRRKWGKTNEDAKDMTQEFFAALCEKDFLDGLSPDQGRFRSYIMAALDNFVRRRHRDDGRLKRGGGAPRLSIECAGIFEPSGGDSPDRAFLRDWARSVLDESLEELEARYQDRGMEKAFRLFRLHDVEPEAGADLSYAALAERLGTTVTDVTNLLYRVRKELREAVLRRVRDTVTSEEEAEEEMRELFGRAPSE
ncbi:MAG: sigma-70 family RNA polymerase sigma factor [Planctomycetes bacterium]|nr:sigma-70 family RNA polymerase sigma factor [Planctomycetota bacterium]